MIEDIFIEVKSISIGLFKNIGRLLIGIISMPFLILLIVGAYPLNYLEGIYNWFDNLKQGVCECQRRNHIQD